MCRPIVAQASARLPPMSTAHVPAISVSTVEHDHAFFGHPRGLSTLFFTEMWERFSYYGIACGHFTLAFPRTTTFYTGLGLIVLGTGLLKPNLSVIVGQLYSAEDDRRDAGFSLFYMGINLGAFIGPIITGFLAQDETFRAWLRSAGLNPNASWHWGFAAAGVGMSLGLVQYVLGGRRLGDAGLHPAPAASREAAARLKRRAIVFIGGGLLLLAVFGAALAFGVVRATAQTITNGYSYALLAITIGFFGWLFFGGDWTPAERKRLYLIGVFFVAAAIFWSVYDQAGSTLNLFADKNTHNVVLGRAFPSSWYQAAPALFVIIFAPVFAWLWVALGRRQPASPTKFALGLVGVGVSFVLLVPAARLAGNGALVSPMWLIATYLLQVFAELSLSPVGLSAMTKLAPARIVSLMMGVWFLATSVGDFLAGRAAGFYGSMSMPRLFGTVALVPIAAGVVMFLFRRQLTALIGETA
jgi:POT family proton-dependent oligopeptide transporter